MLAPDLQEADAKTRVNIQVMLALKRIKGRAPDQKKKRPLFLRSQVWSEMTARGAKREGRWVTVPSQEALVWPTILQLKVPIQTVPILPGAGLSYSPFIA